MTKTSRADERGYHTTITPLGNGRYGVRVLCRGKVVRENNSARSRQEAAEILKAELRWLDKYGYDSPMASASRDRFYCRQKGYTNHE